ncbi:hypothetical protein BRD00_10310 [Halobacteriales archaeon QS_8_69_26]|nr:MAG: hypothetical protein BRD00_10310 [Halobacteriales archaeon QS_8_69_26]
MSGDAGGGEGGRDLGQVLLAAAVVVGLLAAAALLPSVPGGTDSGQLGNGPVDGPSEDVDPRDGLPEVGPGEGSSGLGALNPGDSTDVGGSLGSDGDGLRNTSDTVHFVVETDSPDYWRTGAYGRYTGDGWERESGLSPSDTVRSRSGERVRQRVTLNRSATALPAAWRPTSTSFPNGDPSVYVTRQGAFVVPAGVDAGTTFGVTSYVDRPDPDDLGDSGGSYPSWVDRYREVPDATPDRLAAFTDGLTADADGPYETARVIELWLERSKEYSLDATHDPSRPVAAQFVFEMDRGYCEYFATAMAAMLRTQDIPARYVVGYAPGTAVGEDRYAVRALDAHAWVEAYFPGEGWVRFDPTPAASRRASERESIGRQGGGPDARPDVPGSPGDDGGGLGPGDAPRLPGEEDVTPRTGPPYEVDLDARPVPGREVTVTVTKDGLPVEGVVVTFNGDPVDTTDRNGNVTATVPYDEELRVDAVPPDGGDGGGDDEAGGDDDGTSAGTTPGTNPGSGTPGAVTGAVASVPAAGSLASALASGSPTGGIPAKPSSSAGAVLPSTVRSTAGLANRRSTVRSAPMSDGGGVGNPNGSETAPRSFDLSTNVSWDVAGTLAPGRRAVMVLRIDGVPVRNAAVTFAGRSVGSTDDRGQVPVTVPAEAHGFVDASVQRGELSESTTLDLAHLDVSVEPDTLVALPGVGATVRVTVGDEPVAGAPVTVDGRRVGVTDEEGRIRTSLPTAGEAAVAADGPVMTASTTVGGLYRNAGVLALAVIGLVAVAAHALRRRDVSTRGAAATARGLGGRALSVATRLVRRIRASIGSPVERVGSLVRRVAGLAGWIRRTLAGASERVRAGLVRWVGWVVTRVPASARELRSVLVAAVGRIRSLGVGGSLARVAGTVGGALRRVVLGLPAAVAALVERTRTWLGSGEEGPDPNDRDATGGGSGSADDEGDDVLPPAAAVRTAFRELVRLVGVRRWRTMTPGEIGRAATGVGLPEEPVATVTEAFRDVEYGGREPSAAVRDRVLAALSRLRAAASRGGDG